MEKTIFDIMSPDERKIELFAQACDDMMNTQYILVDSKITAILQSIATSTLLYSLFGKVTKDFDYRAVAKTCLINNETQFRTPQEPKKIAALVFCILLDMDKKNIELHDFLNFFKGGGDTNSAFETFLKEVILPFKNSILYLYNKGKQESAEIEENKNTEKTAQHTLSMFIARINNDAALPDTIKEYLVNLLNSLTTALKNNEIETARNIYSILSKRIKDHKPNLFNEFERLSVNIE